MPDDRSNTPIQATPKWAFWAFFVCWMALNAWQHRMVMQSLEKDLQYAQEARGEILALRRQLGRVEKEIEQLKPLGLSGNLLSRWEVILRNPPGGHNCLEARKRGGYDFG